MGACLANQKAVQGLRCDQVDRLRESESAVHVVDLYADLANPRMGEQLVWRSR